MNRLKTMQTILELHNFFIDEWNKSRSYQMKKSPLLTNDWLKEKFDRFYLVESTTHSEENFQTRIELRYALRSKEAHEFGNTHKAFFDRYIATIAVNIEDVEDPQRYKDEIIKEFTELNKETN